MKRYINLKHGNKVETLEEFNSTDYPSLKDFNTALTTRVGSYRMIHKISEVYVSSRASKGWTGN